VGSDARSRRREVVALEIDLVSGPSSVQIFDINGCLPPLSAISPYVCRVAGDVGPGVAGQPQGHTAAYAPLRGPTKGTGGQGRDRTPTACRSGYSAGSGSACRNAWEVDMSRRDHVHLPSRAARWRLRTPAVAISKRVRTTTCFVALDARRHGFGGSSSSARRLFLPGHRRRPSAHMLSRAPWVAGKLSLVLLRPSNRPADGQADAEPRLRAWTAVAVATHRGPIARPRHSPL